MNNKKKLVFKLATFLIALAPALAIAPTNWSMFGLGEPVLPAKMNNQE